MVSQSYFVTILVVLQLSRKTKLIAISITKTCRRKDDRFLFLLLIKGVFESSILCFTSSFALQSVPFSAGFDLFSFRLENEPTLILIQATHIRLQRLFCYQFERAC